MATFRKVILSAILKEYAYVELDDDDITYFWVIGGIGFPEKEQAEHFAWQVDGYVPEKKKTE